MSSSACDGPPSVGQPCRRPGRRGHRGPDARQLACRRGMYESSVQLHVRLHRQPRRARSFRGIRTIHVLAARLGHEHRLLLFGITLFISSAMLRGLQGWRRWAVLTPAALLAVGGVLLALFPGSGESTNGTIDYHALGAFAGMSAATCSSSFFDAWANTWESRRKPPRPWSSAERSAVWRWWASSWSPARGPVESALPTLARAVSRIPSQTPRGPVVETYRDHQRWM